MTAHKASNTYECQLQRSGLACAKRTGYFRCLPVLGHSQPGVARNAASRMHFTGGRPLWAGNELEPSGLGALQGGDLQGLSQWEPKSVWCVFGFPFEMPQQQAQYHIVWMPLAQPMHGTQPDSRRVCVLGPKRGHLVHPGVRRDPRVKSGCSLLARGLGPAFVHHQLSGAGAPLIRGGREALRRHSRGRMCSV